MYVQSYIKHEHLQQLLGNPLFLKLLDSLKVGTSLTDKEGNILYFSKSGYELYNLKSENSVVGQKIDKLFQTGKEGSLLTAKNKKINNINSRLYNGVEGLCRRVPIVDSSGEVVCVLSEVISTSHSQSYNHELLYRINQLKNLFQQQITVKSGLYSFDMIIGNSAIMQNLKSKGLLFARNSAPILLTGENGTGKELFAQAIHNASTRANNAFIPVNCAALPHDLAEAELFGYEAGAFTGAKKSGQKGLFELADEGTIFLDEISELPLHLQTKLLRVLESKEIQKLGMGKKVYSNFRLIAATNRHIPDMVHQGIFREDLYFRLNILELHLPPLRKHREDIPLLISQLTKEICPPMIAQNFHVSSEVFKIFMQYNWPGNIRELKNVLTYSYCCMENINETELSSQFLPERLLKGVNKWKSARTSLKSLVAESEKDGILSALEKTGYNKSKAAKNLGISRNTLYLKMKEYNIPSGW